MVIMNIPEWLSIILALGFSLFFWSIGILCAMIIGGIFNKGVKQVWSRVFG
jgi:hypothetical protein